MDQAEWKLLKEIAELEKTPQGAYNIRRNGALDSRNSTANIEITTKTEPGKSGIDIRIKPGTRHESVHIPVIISQTGLSEMVYNDFFIGEDCDGTKRSRCYRYCSCRRYVYGDVWCNVK